jgi:hypothetical protein
MMLMAPGRFLELPNPTDGLPYTTGVIAITALAVAMIARPGRDPIDLRFWALIGIHFALGVWLIVHTPEPLIDVFVFQQQGSADFLSGQNPYSIRDFPDIYGPGSGLYGPGLVEDGKLTFGFTYPPLSLFMALPGYLIGGDFRYSQLVAMELTAILMALAVPSRVATLAALLFLFSPRGLFVLEQGWTEPFVVLLLAGTVFAAARSTRAVPLALGALVAVKQHLVLALPLALPFLARSGPEAWRIGWRSALVALLVSAPLILWNVPDFVRSTLILHLEQPFRADSMSFPAWLSTNGEPGLPTWLAFALLVPATVIAWIRIPRTPAGFALAVAFVYMVFFAFSKQAFVHYYWFVMAAACLALAAWPQPPEAVASQPKEGG